MSDLRAESSGRRVTLMVLLLGAVMYLPFLDAWELSYPDEPDVVEPARAMLVSGDWVTPRHGEQAWIDYPPLVFWTQALAGKLGGGLTPFVHRLPDVLAALALTLAVLWFGRARLGATAGLVAAVVLLTMPQFAWQAVNAHPDMLFAALQGVGLLLYVAAERWRPGPAWAARVAAFACLGGAVLAKGPLGLLLPGLVLTLWHASLKQWGRILLLAPLALVAGAVAAPWYLALAEAQGWEFVRSEVLTQNFGRFRAGSGRGHERPPHYYVVRLIPDLGAWLLLPLPFLAQARGLFWRDPIRRFLTIWAGATLILLTLAATKRGVYLLTAYPAFALLLGAWLERLIEATRDPASRAAAVVRALGRLSTWLVVLLAAAGLALPLALPWLVERVLSEGDGTREPALQVGPAGVATGIVLLASLLFWRRAASSGRAGWMVAGHGFAHAALFAVAVAIAVPTFDPTWSYRPVGEHLRQHAAEGEAVGFLAPGLEIRRRAAMLYFSERPLRYFASLDDLRVFLAERPARAAVVGGAPVADLESDPGLARLVVGRFHISKVRWVVLASRGR